MDKQKAEKMYEENVKAVYKYLFCLTHSADLAEELTQDLEPVVHDNAQRLGIRQKCSCVAKNFE